MDPELWLGGSLVGLGFCLEYYKHQRAKAADKKVVQGWEIERAKAAENRAKEAEFREKVSQFIAKEAELHHRAKAAENRAKEAEFREKVSQFIAKEAELHHRAKDVEEQKMKRKSPPSFFTNKEEQMMMNDAIEWFTKRFGDREKTKDTMANLNEKTMGKLRQWKQRRDENREYMQLIDRSYREYRESNNREYRARELHELQMKYDSKR